MNQNVIETKMLTKKHGSQYRVRDLELRVPQNCVYGFLLLTVRANPQLSSSYWDCCDQPQEKSISLVKR